MWTFVALNLHQWADSKMQPNKNKMNNHKSNNIAMSYQRRHMGDEEAMADRVLLTGKV